MDNEQRRELNRIVRNLGPDALPESLTARIPPSDLNTLLLEVFRDLSKKSSPAGLLKRYATNRFVRPSLADPIDLKQLELDALKIARNHSYRPIQLSPVAPLGSCSIVAASDQNKIVSALRGTEVVADATNVLALHICHAIKSGTMSNHPDFIRYSTTHRHVRAQKYDHPSLLSHFHLFCLVASGKDKGSYSFEKQAFAEHIHLYRDIFKLLFDADIQVALSMRSGYIDSHGLVETVLAYAHERLPDVKAFVNAEPVNNQYYKGLQFTIIANINGQRLNIGDGGFVDWSQQLLDNRKERMMISAIGLERLLQE